jgi:hypothetical protein
METLNFTGLSYNFAPVVQNYQNSATATLGNTTIVSPETEVAVYFYKGTMPSEATLYSINDEAALIANQTINADLVCMYDDTTDTTGVEDVELTFTYSVTKKQMNVKKSPVDAVETTASTLSAAADITWCAIVFGNQDQIIFTDSIGVWGDNDKSVIISKTTNIASGDTITLKDISLTIRDNTNH